MKRILLFLLIPAFALTIYSRVSQADYLKMYGPTTQIIVDPGDAVAISVSDSIRQANYIDSTQVKAGGISADDLRAVSVDSTKISIGGVSANNLRAVSVDSAKVRIGGISNSNLRAASVDSTKISTGGVANSNLRALAVDSTKVRANSIAGSKMVNPLRLTGDVIASGQSLGTPTHGSFGFADSSVTLSMVQNIWYGVNNAGKNIWAVVDTVRVTKTPGDSLFIIQDAGDYEITGTVTLVTPAGSPVIWCIQLLHSPASLIGFPVYQSSPASSTLSLPIHAYHAFTAGEAFYLGVKNKSSGADITIQNGSLTVKRVH